MQPSASYMQRWTPLVGERAAKVIWKSEIMSSAYVVAALVLAVAASFGFAVSIPLGVVLAVTGAGCLVLRLRERMRIAQALTDYFGTPITWQHIPVLRPNAFSRACAQEGWAPKQSATPPTRGESVAG